MSSLSPEQSSAAKPREHNPFPTLAPKLLCSTESCPSTPSLIPLQNAPAVQLNLWVCSPQGLISPCCAAAHFFFFTNCSGTFAPLHEFCERIVKYSAVSLSDAFSLSRVVLTKSKPLHSYSSPPFQPDTALRAIINNYDSIEHPAALFPFSDN